MALKTRAGHSLAKVLGITLDASDEDVTRGESVFSVESAGTFIEQPPTTAEWLASGTPSTDDIVAYIRSLFPFLSWIGFYNVQWLLGDLVAGKFPESLIRYCPNSPGFPPDSFDALRLLPIIQPPSIIIDEWDANSCLGITVGAVVIPQGMAYAKLAQLPVEFGLYSSFMGVICYWFFATSKDITIGVCIIIDMPYTRPLLTPSSQSLSCRRLLGTSSVLPSLNIQNLKIPHGLLHLVYLSSADASSCSLA